MNELILMDKLLMDQSLAVDEFSTNKLLPLVLFYLGEPLCVSGLPIASYGRTLSVDKMLALPMDELSQWVNCLGANSFWSTRQVIAGEPLSVDVFSVENVIPVNERSMEASHRFPYTSSGRITFCGYVLCGKLASNE